MSGDRYHISDQNAMHFMTFTVIDWVDVFSRKEHKLQLVDSLNSCIKEKGLVMFGWVIMSNHMHIICQAKDGFKLSDIVRDFKKFTAKRIIKQIKEEPESRMVWMLNKFEYAGSRIKRVSKYKFWQDGSHAIYLDDHDNNMIDQKLEYIHNNPVAAMLVYNSEDYVFSSAIDYAGGKGLVDITLI